MDGSEVSLTPVEYKIVKYLMENRGLVFSSTQIYENVWNEPSYGADNIVAVHIRHIREKNREQSQGAPLHQGDLGPRVQNGEIVVTRKDDAP